MAVFTFLITIFSLAPAVVSNRCHYSHLPLVDTTKCAPEPKCNSHAKYRTIDGSCSNLRHPAWAKSGLPFVRVEQATYYDGKSEPRRSVKGGPLPHARSLSSAFFHYKFVPDHINSNDVAQWGQLIAHDVTLIVFNTTIEAGKGCCTSDNKVPDKDHVSVNCLPIQVHSDDSFYSHYNVTCLNFTRASLADSCHNYPIQQLNNVTSVIDGSMVYGSHYETAKSLRTFSHGKLKVQYSTDGRTFLPNSDNPNRCFNSSACYKAGDDRVNQNPGIAVHQTVLMRLHNNLCKQLTKLNPSWSDEKMYQEVRKIVGAVIQHITYTYYLPIILGTEYMKARGMYVDPHPDKCENYHDSCVNPATLAEFAGSSFRSFHSLVPTEMIFMDKDYEPNSFIYLHDYFNRPSILQDHNVLDMTLRSLTSQPCQAMDSYVTYSLTHLLFKFDKEWGNDLESIDIMRGRDKGLPPYNRMRELCGLKRAKDFEDLRDVMTEESIGKMKSLYRCVDDIDLFTGGV